jgi:hypothetical protein
VWAQLGGSVRLVHLMQDDAGIEEALPALLKPPHVPSAVSVSQSLSVPAVALVACESPSFYCTVVEALASLRSDSDRSWSIVRVALYQIARYLHSQDTLANQGVGISSTTPIRAPPSGQLLCSIFDHLRSVRPIAGYSAGSPRSTGPSPWWILISILKMLQHVQMATAADISCLAAASPLSLFGATEAVVAAAALSSTRIDEMEEEEELRSVAKLCAAGGATAEDMRGSIGVQYLQRMHLS